MSIGNLKRNKQTVKVELTDPLPRRHERASILLREEDVRLILTREVPLEVVETHLDFWGALIHEITIEGSKGYWRKYICQSIRDSPVATSVPHLSIRNAEKIHTKRLKQLFRKTTNLCSLGIQANGMTKQKWKVLVESIRAEGLLWLDIDCSYTDSYPMDRATEADFLEWSPLPQNRICAHITRSK